MGQTEVDLLATSIPRQVEVYFANLEDYKATNLKAFSENWNRFKSTYIFPPLVLMEMTPNRFYQCLGESRFIVICPWELRALWFLRLIKLTIQQPIRIRRSWSTGTDLTESGKKISVTAWMLSGKDVHKLENCPVGRSRHRTPKSVTIWDSDATGTSTGLIIYEYALCA